MSRAKRIDPAVEAACVAYHNLPAMDGARYPWSEWTEYERDEERLKMAIAYAAALAARDDEPEPKIKTRYFCMKCGGEAQP